MGGISSHTLSYIKIFIYFYFFFNVVKDLNYTKSSPPKKCTYTKLALFQRMLKFNSYFASNYPSNTQLVRWSSSTLSSWTCRGRTTSSRPRWSCTKQPEFLVTFSFYHVSFHRSLQNSHAYLWIFLMTSFHFQMSR